MELSLYEIKLLLLLLLLFLLYKSCLYINRPPFWRPKMALLKKFRVRTIINRCFKLSAMVFGHSFSFLVVVCCLSLKVFMISGAFARVWFYLIYAHNEMKKWIILFYIFCSAVPLISWHFWHLVNVTQFLSTYKSKSIFRLIFTFQNCNLYTGKYDSIT